ncbi:MAG TPA: MBL fold metallo-hydrolase [Burkholderiales bacterium]|nr:MBL fold metallo-hydrolase [Burkholderiales bacterium]
MNLPRDIQVLERGWLSSNNVVLHARDGATVIDSGYGAHAPQTVALIGHALRGGPLARLVNTHCHSDHMGGNAAVQRRFGCRTSIPAGEARLIDRWDERELILSAADQRAERFAYDDTFGGGDTLRMGEYDWRVLAAPGHDTHAVMFYSPETRALVSGDALWENGFGAVFAQLFGRETALAETRDTLERIAELDCDVVIPGHGRPFGNVGAALERAFSRLRGYEDDVTRLARHVVRVLFAFALLEKRSMPLAGVQAYLERVAILSEINRNYLGMAPADFAEWLIADLERAGAAERKEGLLLAKDG